MINYYEFISSHSYKACDDALKRIAGKINIEKINELIDSVIYISENHKEILKKIIRARKDIIIDKNLQ